jgi:hypothetical protein
MHVYLRLTRVDARPTISNAGDDVVQKALDAQSRNRASLDKLRNLLLQS